MNNWITYKDEIYLVGTVIKLKECYKKKYDFNTYLKYKRTDHEKQAYYFGSLNSPFENYYITEAELNNCIEKIETPYRLDNTELTFDKVPEKYVDGIVSAWIIYICVMVFAFFLNGTFSTIIVQIIATVVFTSWRNKKKNGG